jgi:hypothetical protein
VSARELGESSLQIAPVPEVSIAKDCDALLDEHHVGATGQPGIVEAIAEPTAPEFTP